MRKPVAATFLILATAIVALAQDMRFQTATMTRNQSASRSGGSQILPDGRVIITNTSVRDMLRVFYDIPEFAIIGAPEWFTSERYDITAQAAGNPSRDALKQMMRTVLAEQLQLVLHQEARPLPVFELRRSRADGSLGPNLVPARTNCEIGGTAACPHELTGGSYTAVAMPMARIVRTLAELAGRPVIDRTNLSGPYDVKLTWAPGPSTFLTAVREQLGLELEPRDEPAQVLVIDSVGRLKSP
jgi:bla regulator protein blaR1